MGFDYSRLTEITGVTTAGTTHIMYTNPSGTTSYVRQIMIHSADLLNFSAATVQIYSVPASGGNAGYAQVTNEFFSQSLTTGSTYFVNLGTPGLILKNVNDTLQMVHTSKTTFNYYVMGGIEI